jgi:hypothetical protein
MFFNRGLSMAGSFLHFIQAHVGFVAALETVTAAHITKPINVECVRILKQPVLTRREIPKVSGRRLLETLTGLERR